MQNESPTRGPSFYLQHALKDSIGGRKPTQLEIPSLDVPSQETIGSGSVPASSDSSETDPRGIPAQAPGSKLDNGKVDVLRGAYRYFPKALEAVADVSQRGAAKYSWDGWRSVPDGINRYGAALARHLACPTYARDTGVGGLGPDVLHAAQVAWNALARLELILIELEEEKDDC